MESEFGAAAARSDPGLDLATRIRAGDPQAEEEFAKPCRRGLLVIANVRSRDQEAVRDLTQEILIAVLKALRESQFRDATKLKAFVHRTARNLINNYIRSKSRQPECELNSVVERSGDLVEKLESADRHRLIPSRTGELRSHRPADSPPVFGGWSFSCRSSSAAGAFAGCGASAPVGPFWSSNRKGRTS